MFNIEAMEVLSVGSSESKPDIVGNPNSELLDNWLSEAAPVAGENDEKPDIGLVNCCMAMAVNAEDGSDDVNGIDDSCVNEGMP